MAAGVLQAGRDIVQAFMHNPVEQDINLIAMEAIREKDLERIRDLFKKGADLENMIRLSIRARSPDVLRMLLTEHNFDLSGELGESFLYSSINYNSHECVQTLLECGYDVSRKIKEHFPPQCYASYIGAAQALGALLERGADPDVDTGDGSGNVSLHLALFQDRDAAVEVLLNAGANPHLLNKQRKNPLFMAAERCNVIALNALLRAGAYLVKDIEGRSPLTLPSGKGLFDTREGVNKVLQKWITSCTEDMKKNKQEKGQFNWGHLKRISALAVCRFFTERQIENQSLPEPVVDILQYVYTNCALTK